MEDLRELLSQVNEGITSFKPKGNTKEELVEFQSTAKALLYAKDLGYVEECKSIREHVTGNAYHTVIITRGGLTYLGIRYLKQQNTIPQNKLSAAEEIVELRPNFFGLGVNLRAFWRWLIRKNA